MFTDFSVKNRLLVLHLDVDSLISLICLSHLMFSISYIRMNCRPICTVFSSELEL